MLLSLVQKQTGLPGGIMKKILNFVAAVSALVLFMSGPVAYGDELSCADGGVCQIGDMGPGGGTVFFVSNSLNSWGRYIEAAPYGWFKGRPDPNVEPFCYEKIETLDFLPETSPAIGSGKSNTDKLVKVCPNGAAATARAYDGGGFKTWSLPSKDELTELYYELPQAGIENEWYWSSTTTKYGQVSSFYVPREKWDGTFSKSNDANVRAVRHFMTAADAQVLKEQKIAAEKSYKNCTLLNKKFPGGIAKTATTKNKGSKTKKTPYVSSKGYNLNKKLDKDKDGIVCEK